MPSPFVISKSCESLSSTKYRQNVSANTRIHVRNMEIPKLTGSKAREVATSALDRPEPIQKPMGYFRPISLGKHKFFKINLFGSYLDRPRSWSDLLFRSDSLKHLASATMPFGLVSRVSTETRLKGSFQNCKQWKNTSKQERSSRWIRPTDSGYFLDQPLCQDSASRFQGPGGFMRYRKVL